MTTSSQTRTEPPYVAELVSAAGAVLKCSLEGALEKLIGALEDKSEKAPYCAIVTQRDKTPSAAQAWRSCLTAWNRVEQFLESTPGEELRKTHWMSELEWPEDMRLVFPIRDEEIHRKASDIARFYVDKSHPRLSLPVEDVFLLLTPSKLEEMLPTRLTGVLADECVLIHVIGEGSVKSRWYPTGKRRSEESLAHSHSDEDLPADGPTLAWRQWFVKTVKCLTATQVAEEGGHQAKNTSATASRWSSEGKIFCVRHAGQLLYPAFQFRHGQPLPVIARVMRALGKDPTGWDYAFFLATPNAYLGGDRPMDRLHDSKMEEELVRLADRHSHPADVF
jgi:hypothetical protein